MNAGEVHESTVGAGHVHHAVVPGARVIHPRMGLAVAERCRRAEDDLEPSGNDERRRGLGRQPECPRSAGDDHAIKIIKPITGTDSDAAFLAGRFDRDHLGVIPKARARRCRRLGQCGADLRGVHDAGTRLVDGRAVVRQCDAELGQSTVSGPDDLVRLPGVPDRAGHCRYVVGCAGVEATTKPHECAASPLR